MASKKKILVLLSAVMAMAAGTMVAVAGFRDSNVYNESNDDGGVFELDLNSIKATSEESDVYQAAMTFNGNTIDIKLSGGYLSGDYFTVDSQNWAFITNLESSPIRGIDSLVYYFTSTTYTSLYTHVYFSYNPLTIENILNGDYQDLDYSYFRDNVDPNSLTPRMINSSPDYRYFLVAVCPQGNSVSLGAIGVQSHCDEEPAKVDVGKYPDTYGSNMDAVIPDDFPFIGNGSIKAKELEDSPFDGFEIEGLQREGKQQQFFADLLAIGFQKVSKYAAYYDIYQKPSHDDLYYTVVDTGVVCQYDGYENISFAYLGEQTSLAGKDYWPQDEIADYFNEPSFVSQITDIGLSMGTKYMLITAEEENQRMMNIQAIFPEDISIETISSDYAKALDYIAGLKSLGYFASSEYTYGSIDDGQVMCFAQLEGSNLKHQVIIQYVASINEEQTTVNCIIALTSYEMSAFPSAELIEYFEGDYFVNIPGEALYRPNTFSGSDTPGEFDVQKSKRYITAGLSSDDIASYLSSLEDDGWMVNNLSATKIHSSTSIPFGARIRFRTNANYTEIIFETGVASRSANNIREAVYSSVVSSGSYPSSVDSVLDGFVSTVYSTFGSGKYYYKHTGEMAGTVICAGKNQFVWDAVAEHLTYIEQLGQHVYYNGVGYALVISHQVESNCLVLQLSVINYEIIEVLTNLVDAATINAGVDSLLNENGITSDLDKYHFTGEGNIFSYFNNGKNNQFSVLTDDYESVNAVRNSYISSLISLETVKYSSYLEQYVNTSNNLGIKVTGIEHKYGKYTFSVSLSFNTSFKDYVSYDELDLSAFQYEELIPSLNVDDEKHFVMGGCYYGHLSFNADPAFYESYKATVISEYAYVNYCYRKVSEDGTQISIILSDSNRGIGINVEPNYYRTLDEVKSRYSSYSDVFSSFVLPEDSGKKYHSDYVYDEGFELYIHGVDIDNYCVLLENSGYHYEDGDYIKLEGNTIYSIFIQSDYIGYHSETFETFSYSQLSSTLEDNGFDVRRFGCFVLSESFGDDVALRRWGEQSFDILIVNSSFDEEAYIQELLAAGYSNEKEDNVFYNNDSDTTITLSNEYGLTRIEYFDRREFFYTFDEIKNRIMNSGMESKRFAEFVDPEQEGELYRIIYCSNDWFELSYNEDLFDFSAYKAKLDSSEYTLEYGDTYNGEYKYIYNEASIYYDSFKHTIRYSNYHGFYGLTFDEALESAVKYGFNANNVSYFVNPEQENIIYDTYVECDYFNVTVRIYSKEFNFDEYKQKLEQNGYIYDEFDGSYVKNGYSIRVNEWSNSISLNCPMDLLDTIDSAVDQGFDANCVSRLVLPPTLLVRSNSVLAVTSRGFYLFNYIESSFDIDAYKELLAENGYVLNTDDSNEAHLVYEKDCDQIIIDTNNKEIQVQLAYSYDEISSDICSSIEWFNGFVDPEQENAKYLSWQVDSFSRRIEIHFAKGTFNTEAYINKLVGLGFVKVSEYSDEYSNGEVDIIVETDRIIYFSYYSFNELKKTYSEHGLEYTDVFYALVDPEQEGVGYIISGYGDNYCSFRASKPNFDAEAYGNTLVNSYGYTLIETHEDYNVYQKDNIDVFVYENSVTFQSPMTYSELINRLKDRGYQSYPETLGENELSGVLFYEIRSFWSSSSSYSAIYLPSTFDVNAYCNTLENAGYVIKKIHENFIRISGEDISIFIYPLENRIAVYHS